MEIDLHRRRNLQGGGNRVSDGPGQRTRGAAGSLLGSAIVRERVDRQLREIDARYRALVEEMPAITYIDQPDPTSPTGYRPIFLSPQVETMLGYSVRELESRSELWYGILHEEDRDRALAADAAHHATGNPLNHEYRVISRDGRVVWVRDQARMVRDELGRPKFSHGVLLDITERKRAEAELQRTMAELERTDRQRRALLARLVKAQEQERARIANDIHDDTIQHLATVSVRLDIVRQQVEDPQVIEDVEKLQEGLRRTIDRLRHLLVDLRPPFLDQEGLIAALQASLDRFRQETGVAVSLDAAKLTTEPPADTGVIVFRIVQEALMNVRKLHGRPPSQYTSKRRTGGSG